MNSSLKIKRLNFLVILSVRTVEKWQKATNWKPIIIYKKKKPEEYKVWYLHKFNAAFKHAKIV